MRFLGYDPGGKMAHGVACLDVPEWNLAPPSEFKLETMVAKDTASAIDWLRRHQNGAVALGIDTLLLWTLGDRTCDKFLRKKYAIPSGSVQSLGSLRGAMVGNGILVARKFELPLFEANPKAALKAEVLKGYEHIWAGLKGSEDHRRDAVVAAIIAGLGYSEFWSHDLFERESDPYFPAGPSRYPWPCSVEDN